MVRQFIFASFIVLFAFVGASVLGKGLFHANALGNGGAEEGSGGEENAAATISKDEVLRVKDSDIILGNVDAPVTMYEFASLSCTHCAKFNTQVLPELDEKYIKTGKLRLIVREFPLNAPALKAAQLTRCVDKNQFHKFLKVLFSMQEKWAFTSDYLEDLEKIARVGGVTEEEFVSCMANKEVEKLILDNRREAEAALNIEATPTFFLKSEVIDADYIRVSGVSSVEFLSKAIESLMGDDTTAGDGEEE